MANSINGKINNPGDVDCIKVNLTAGQVYIFSLTSSDEDLLNDGLSLEVLDSSGQSVDPIAFTPTALVMQVSGYGDNPGQTSITAPTSGSYYLRVASNSQTTGTYSLSVAIGAADDYVSNTTTTGTISVGASSILGSSGNDTLNSTSAADVIHGLAGNDLYIVDSLADRVYETTTLGGTTDAGGTDTLQSSVTSTLGNYVETLTLTGSAAINGTGNALGNVIIGNSAANVLTGGAGRDTLTGGNGADLFRYTASADGNDTITDFVSGTDKLQFVSSQFGNITASLLRNGRFVSNANGNASGSNAQFIFNTRTGVLTYDSNGVGSGGATTIATLNSRTLSVNDFVMVSS